jgi:hypothetical protein
MRGLLSILVLVACGGDGTPAPAPGEAPPPAPEETRALGIVGVEVVGTGSVRSEPAGIDCPGRCEASFPLGTRVKLSPTPAEGWRLLKWAGACAGAAACELDVDAADRTDVQAALALVDPRWDPSFGAGDCADAWGTAGEKLSPCDKTPDDYVVVRKSARNVALCAHGNLVRNYRGGLGFAPTGTKQKQGDGKTPEGVFFIPRLVPNSTYYKAFLLSYPTKEDANRGLSEGLVTAAERTQIHAAHDGCSEPPQSTGLGGLIEIHGKGSAQDWTHGCVALDDKAVDALWTVVTAGDSIVVLP